LNCEAAEAERPCHDCRQCKRIGEAKHADVQELSIASPCDEENDREHDHVRRPATVIRLCQVQRVRRTVAEAPFEGRTRVVLVDPADLLNNESANALLKTLEEPPPHVVLILLTAREEALPETVRSRCRRIESQAVPVAEIAEYVSAQYAAGPSEAQALARLSRGRIGWAMVAARDSGLDRGREIIESMVALTSAGRRERFEAADELARLWRQDRSAVRDLLEAWGDWWRDLLLAAAGRPQLIAHAQLAQLAGAEAERFNPVEITAFLESLAHVQGYLEDNINPQLALEVMLLTLPSGADRKENRVSAVAR